MASHRVRLLASGQGAAALEAEKTFAAAISHELRNSVAVLRISAQLLLDQTDVEVDLKRNRALVQNIHRQADKLARLVAYLLDVSSSEASPLIARRDTDLLPLVQAVAESAQMLTDRHSVRVRASWPVWAKVDADRIEQVLWSLLDNAIKYSPNGGSIDVELAECDERTVSIAVRDHGVGIPPEHRRYIFDRLSKAHDPCQQGLGLGLYLAKRILEQHGGSLAAEFPADGGTRLVASLPRASDADGRPS